jgi:DNA-binding IclR family transcriptional regulator
MSSNPKKKLRPLVPSVAKAFKILEFMAAQKEAYTITELSRRFKIPVSTMNNLLLTMVYCGYLSRNAKGSFRVTMKLVEESSKVLENHELRDMAHDELERLSGLTELGAVLLVRDGDQMVCIDKAEGASQIRLAANIGRRFHLHSTATGKLVLADLPPAEVEEIAARTGLPPVTPHTITKLDELFVELEKIRTRGYAEDNEENTVGIRGVAAPVFDHTRAVVGAISTGGLGVQLDDRMKAVIESVQEAARTVSARLGFRAPDDPALAAKR